jgi:O-antigen/teichoic acid export membrane protein
MEVAFLITPVSGGQQLLIRRQFRVLSCVCMASPDNGCMLMSAAFLVSALIQFALGLVVAWILGAAEFGAYALALSASVLAQTLLFEWMRLAATRFHHAEADRGLVRLLQGTMMWLAAGMVILSGAAAIFGGARAMLFALIPLLAAVAGYADFRAALLRAEFEQRLYALFMLLRNLFAVILLPLAGWMFGRAEPVLAAFLLAIALASVLLELKLRLKPELSKPHIPKEIDAPVVGPGLAALLRYSGPIVVTNALYLGLFFGLRSLAAVFGGLAVAGQVSLALDFVLKLFTTAGTAFDLALFQLAVRDQRMAGEAAGRARLRQNLEALIALVAPMMLGLVAVIGMLEPFLVAPDYRGAFATFVVMLVPGIGLYALVQYGLHPFFQLRQQTAMLVIAAALALGIAAGLSLGLMLLPVVAPLRIGLSLALAVAGAAGFLVAKIGRADLPARAFWARQAGALAAMAGVLFVLGKLGGGLGPLLAMIAGGAVSYGLVVWGFNLGGVRQLLMKSTGGSSPLS